MVASTRAKAVAAKGMYFTPWTVERSSATFGSVASATWPPGTFGNLNQYPGSVGGYYLNHAGVSALDYEDMVWTRRRSAVCMCGYYLPCACRRTAAQLLRCGRLLIIELPFFLLAWLA